MALKAKITKDQFEALSDALKAEYKEQDGAYVLDVEGIEDAGALRRAHDRTKQELAEAKQRSEELAQKLAELDHNDARKRGDIETLEKSWKTKLDAEVSAREARIKKLEESARNAAIEATANQLASALTDHTKLLMPHIRSRIDAEVNENGQAVIRFLDAEGKPTAMTADDLQKEFASNKDFHGIIRVSKASGGGAGAGASGSGVRSDAAASSGSTGGKMLASMNPKDLAAVIAAKKESGSA